METVSGPGQALIHKLAAGARWLGNSLFGWSRPAGTGRGPHAARTFRGVSRQHRRSSSHGAGSFRPTRRRRQGKTGAIEWATPEAAYLVAMPMLPAEIQHGFGREYARLTETGFSYLGKCQYHDALSATYCCYYASTDARVYAEVGCVVPLAGSEVSSTSNGKAKTNNAHEPAECNGRSPVNTPRWVLSLISTFEDGSYVQTCEPGANRPETTDASLAREPQSAEDPQPTEDPQSTEDLQSTGDPHATEAAAMLPLPPGKSACFIRHGVGLKELITQHRESMDRHAREHRTEVHYYPPEEIASVCFDDFWARCAGNGPANRGSAAPGSRDDGRDAAAEAASGPGPIGCWMPPPELHRPGPDYRVSRVGLAVVQEQLAAVPAPAEATGEEQPTSLTMSR